MSGVKVGELFAELGIRDLTQQQLREAEREFERATMRMDRIADPSLGVDTSGFDVDVATAVRRIERFGTTTGDARLDVDTSGVERGVGRSESMLRGIDAPDLTPTVDPGGIEDAESDLRSAISGLEVPLVGAAAAAGAAAGVALVDSFLDWAARDKETDRLAAALGLSDAEAERYGKIAGDIYVQAWGDSLGQVNEALAAGSRESLFDGNSTAAEVEAVTTRLLTMADLFGQDIPHLAAAAGTMIKTGMARDVWEALDILTVGFQGPANKADDLLDTFNEYSTMFRSLGIDGPAALGLIQQGLEFGARDADTVADALKEFSIIGQEGGDRVARAAQLLGFDPIQYQKDVAAGGDTARNALDMVLDKLRATDDPVKRNAAAVELFGTKAEDLQGALDGMDVTTAVDGLDTVAGAAEGASERMNDNLATDIEALQRRTKVAIEDYLGSLWEAYDEGGFTGLMEKLDEDLGKLGDWWDENGDELLDRIGEWWDETGGPAFGALAGEAMKIGLQAAIDAVVDWIKGDSMSEPIVTTIIEQLLDFFVKYAPDLATGVGDGFKGVFDAVAGGIADALNWVIEAWNDVEFKLPSFEGLEVAGRTVIPGWEGPTIGTPDVGLIGGGGGGGSSYGGTFGEIGDAIPRFRDGGQVLAPEGSPVLALVHGGEVVRNPQQEAARDRLLVAALESGGAGPRMVGGGNSFTIHNHGALDESKLARRLDRQALFGRAS